MENRLVENIKNSVIDRMFIMLELNKVDELDYNRAYIMGMISVMYMAGMVDADEYIQLYDETNRLYTTSYEVSCEGDENEQ